jgi:ABC-type spermidine/putrescine transport system permease subunit II
MAAFMVTHDNITLPVLLWVQWSSGNAGGSAAISLIFVAMFLPLIAIYWTIRARSDVTGMSG